MELDITAILKEFPLRVAITDFCNLQCFFCSNEGMGKCNKNKSNVDFELLKELLTLLRNEGLEKIALTGGEPAIYPKIKDLIEHINSLNFKQAFFHTNGIFLTNDLLNSLSKFTKIGISIHSFDYLKWNAITGGKRKQFDTLLKNLDHICAIKSKQSFPLIEIKHVVVKDINSDESSLKMTLDFCLKNKFKFKFLNCEPITSDDLEHIESSQTIKQRLINVGCEEIPQDIKFRGQNDYNPIFNFTYNGLKGVFIEIGCGKKIACKYCFLTNETFITPTLEIKSCHASNVTYSLKEDLKKGDFQGILDKIYNSRLFLFNFPKQDRRSWEDE